VYPAAILQERKPVKARSAFIYADVNIYCPSITLVKKKETYKYERKAATYGDMRASSTPTTSK
jgi:hypothetical protein